MAYERLSEKKIIATNLGSFIQSQIVLLKLNAIRRNLEDEVKFNEAVLSGNLSLEQQLKYRRDQLKRVSKGDLEERRRIRIEIAGLKGRIKAKEFEDEFLSELTEYNSGIQSIDETIAWLEQKRSSNTNEDIDRKIRDNLNSFKAKKYEQQQAVLASQTEYAKNNKTESVLTKQIERVNDARIEAIESGNDDYAALLDLQLQGLNTAITESKITSALTDMSVNTITGQSSASMLDTLNSVMENGDGNIPITVGGQKYDSEKEFWNFKRTEYLNDRSANGFFGRYQQELMEKVEYKNIKGVLHNDSLRDVKNWYDTLKDRPELADYIERIEKDQQTALKAAADLRANSIINEFAIKSDAKKAISDLAYIQDTYGIDMTTNYQKVVMSAAKEKESQVREILASMEQIMKNTGVSSQAALTQAIKSGAGASFSAEELATQKASDIITGAGEKAEGEQFGEGGKTTVGKEGEPFATPQYEEGGLYKTHGDSTIFKYENGKLRAFTGNFDDDMFKKASGKGFGEVKEVENITGVPTGEPIMAEQYKPKPEERGEQIFHPDLMKYYKPDQIITQGQEKFLKQDVKAVWGKRLAGPEWTAMQNQYAPDVLENKIVRAGKDIYLKQ